MEVWRSCWASVIYVKADTCVDVYNIRTRQKIKSLGPVGHGADDLINPNFILSVDNDRVLLDEGNLKKIVEIGKDDDGSMQLKKYIPYPDSIFMSSETNLSENYIAGRKIDAINGKMFFVYNRTTGKIMEVECPFFCYVIVKTCSDIFYTIGQKKCPMPSAKIRNYSHSHNLVSQ